MRAIALVALCCLAFASCLYAAEPTAATPPPVIEEADSIPFQLVQGYVILVRGQIGDRKDLNLMVETGASPTVVDARLARELGIAGQPIGMALPNATVQVQSAEIPSLQIGRLRRTSQKVVVGDLTALRSHLGVSIDALIGLDVLGTSSFTIDYQHKRLILGLSPTDSFIPYVANNSLAIVTLKAGGKPFRVLMDTGTPGLLLFRNAKAQPLPGVTFVRGQDMRNMHGWMRVDQVKITTVTMGDRDLGTTEASIADSQQAQWSKAFDGVLGPSSLRLKTLTFDVGHHILGWTK